MNNGRSHPDQPTPAQGLNGAAGISEQLLIDLIEDQPIAEADRARIGAALLADPALSRMVAEMRADRVGLVELGHIKAPAGLLDGVEAMLERQALLGLATSEVSAVPASIPISQYQPAANRTDRAVTVRRIGYGLALAAGLAIVATVSFWAVRKPASPVVRDITRENGKKAAPNVNPNTVTPAIVPGGSNDSIAINNAAPVDTINPTIEIATPGPTNVGKTDPEVNPVDPVPTIAEATPVKLPFGMPLDRALDLAREGRLLVRVKAKSIDAATTQLDRMKDRSASAAGSGGRLIALAAPQAAELAGVVRREHDRAIEIARALTPFSPVPPFFANQNGTPNPFANRDPHAFSPKPATTVIDAAPALGPSAYALDVPADERALRRLLKRLPAGGDIAVELTEVTSEIVLAVPPDASTILWWTSTGTWTGTLSVPVVVEGK